MNKNKIKITRSLVALLVAAGVSAGGYTLAKSGSNYAERNESFVIDIDNDKINEKFEEYFGEMPKDDNEEQSNTNSNSDVETTDETVTETPTETPQPTELPNVVEPTIEEPVVEEPVIVREPKSTYGLKLKSTAILNMRLNSSEQGFVIGTLPKDAVVDAIYSTGEWELIEFNDKIAYVKSDYTEEMEEESNEQEKYTSYNDIVTTIEPVSLKARPSTEANGVIDLEANKRLTVIGKIIENGEEWYLAKFETNIGYVKANQTSSIKETVKGLNPSVEDVKVINLAYFKQDTPVYDANGEEIATKKAYEFVEVIYEDGEVAIVETDGVVGKVSQDSYEIIDTALKMVDLSDQRFYYYCDNDLVFTGKCTTGHSSTPTRIGYFTPFYRERGHNFGPQHNYVESKILWEPFNGGQGFHDAPWQRESTFGEPGYETYHGSAGCVRLPDSVATFISKETAIKDKVLIKG